MLVQVLGTDGKELARFDTEDWYIRIYHDRGEGLQPTASVMLKSGPNG